MYYALKKTICGCKGNNNISTTLFLLYHILFFISRCYDMCHNMKELCYHYLWWNRKNNSPDRKLPRLFLPPKIGRCCK